MLGKLKAEADKAKAKLEDAAVKAKAELASRGGEALRVAQMGMVAAAKGAAGSSIKAINIALSGALPYAQIEIGQHLLKAAADDEPLLTFLPRPPSKAKRVQMEAEGKSLPPALYEVRVRLADGQQAPAAGACALEVLSLTLRPRQSKKKKTAARGTIKERFRKRFGSSTGSDLTNSSYQQLTPEAEGGGEETEEEENALPPPLADAVPDEFAAIAEQIVIKGERVVAAHALTLPCRLPDHPTGTFPHLPFDFMRVFVSADVEVDMAVAIGDDYNLEFYAKATGAAGCCLPHELWSVELRCFTFRGPARLWWDPLSSRILVAFLQHELPEIECDVKNLRLMCCLPPDEVLDAVVSRIASFITERYTVDRPLGVSLANIGSRKKASAGARETAQAGEPTKQESYRQALDSWDSIVK